MPLSATARQRPPPQLRLAAPGPAGLDGVDLRRLQVFDAVVACGGLSAATAVLQVDLSTVSRQVKALETELGVRLARRGRSGFSLTPEGERFHEACRQLLGALDSFSLQRQTLARPAPPRLRLGLVDALATGPGAGTAAGLSAVLARCAQAVPGLEVQLCSRHPRQIDTDVLSGELDAGVTAAGTPAAGLQQHRLYTEHNSLYVAPGHPWYPHAERDPGPDALASGLLVVDPFWAQAPQPVQAPNRCGQTQADSMEGVALLVCSGQWAGFLPDHLVAATGALHTLRRVCPQRYSHTQDIVLTCRRGKVSPALRQLLRALPHPP